MIKCSTLIKRKEGMAVDEFQRRWRHEHGPLAAKTPGLRGYIQCLTLPEEYQGENAPDYDGVDEMWFDDMAALEQSRGTLESSALMANAGGLTSEMTPLFAEEVVLLDNFRTLDDRKGFVKYIAMLYLKDGVPIGDFQHHWKDVHGPINVRNIKGMKRYVQSHILPQMFEGPDPPAYGGLPEAWFESVSAMRGAPRDPNAQRDTEWPNFCSGQQSIFTREVAILP